MIVFKFWYITWQKGNWLHHSIDWFQNHKSQFEHSNQNSKKIRWLRLYHDKRLVPKCDRGHISMIQHFQSFRHQNLKQIYDFSLNDSRQVTYRWQLFRLSRLKHIKTFSSGMLKMLKDPTRKSNCKSKDCLIISQPTTILTLKYECQFKINKHLYLPGDSMLILIRPNTKIDHLMLLHSHHQQTLHYHIWNPNRHWQLLKTGKDATQWLPK